MDELLLTSQLLEWAEIEEDYDQIPWTITDPTDEEVTFDRIEKSLNRHQARAASGPPPGKYFTRLNCDQKGMPVYINHGTKEYPQMIEPFVWSDYDGGFRYMLKGKAQLIPSHRPECHDTDDVSRCHYGMLDKSERFMTSATLTHFGPNYIKASTPFGDCYIDLKYSRYVPNIGEDFSMLCRSQPPGSHSIPLKCIKVIV